MECDNNLNVEINRLNSFRTWPNNDVSKESLARAGFIYLQKEDHVKCNFCGVQIRIWSRGDNAFIEHEKHSPSCSFLNEDLVNNRPIAETEHILSEELAYLRNRKKVTIENLSTNEIAAIARHPTYADKNERLKSFNGWLTSLKQTPQEMSDAGFFYLGVGDEVKCFYCGGCLRNFVSSDNALYEHKKYYFERCEFVQYIFKNSKSLSENDEKTHPIDPTSEQIRYLIEFKEKDECLQSGSLSHDHDACKIMWIDLAKSLNCLNGAIKDVNGWQEVWRNHKSNQKRKYSLVDEHTMGKTSKRLKQNASAVDDVEVKSESNLKEIGLVVTISLTDK